MGKQFLCDYCLKGFPDNKSSREKHLRSNQHKNAYREYYVSCCNPQEVFAFLPGNVGILKLQFSHNLFILTRFMINYSILNSDIILTIFINILHNFIK